MSILSKITVACFNSPDQTPQNYKLYDYIHNNPNEPWTEFLRRIDLTDSALCGFLLEGMQLATKHVVQQIIDASTIVANNPIAIYGDIIHQHHNFTKHQLLPTFNVADPTTLKYLSNIPLFVTPSLLNHQMRQLDYNTMIQKIFMSVLSIHLTEPLFYANDTPRC